MNSVCRLIVAGALALLATTNSAQGMAERRLALVIGNNAYPHAELKNAVNDAATMTTALRECQFTVHQHTDVTLRQLDDAVDRFVKDVKAGDVVVVYYSGHGFQLAGENYLVPVNFKANDEVDAKYAGYSANRLLERVGAQRARLTVVILDSCRSSPFGAARGAPAGLAPMQTGSGTYIAFATGPGSTASDDPEGVNGLFTGQLLKGLRQPGWNLDRLFGWVRKQVFTASSGEQLPWTSSSVIDDFWFRPDPGAVVAGSTWGNSGDVRQVAASGTRSLSAGRYDEAVTLFDRAIVLAEKRGAIQPFEAVSRGFTQRERTASTLSRLAEAIAANPRDIGARRKRATLLVSVQRPGEAIDDLVAIQGSGALGWQDYAVLAVATLQQRRMAEAVAAGRLAIKMAPEIGMPHCVLADIEYAAGQYSVAVMEANACAQHGGPKALAARIQGNALRELGQFADAAKMYRIAIDAELQ